MPLAVIPSPPLNGFELGPLDIRFYGILIATGVLLAMTMTRRRFVAKGGDGEFADRVAFRSVVAGFLGARLAYVLPRWETFVDDPIGILQIWEGGLALFGGLIAGTVAVLWQFRNRRGDLPAFGDAAAPAVPAAQALGRWGNYFNQELYGTPSTLPWALEVDPAYRVDRYAEFATFHPTFLYESIYNVGLVAFLLWIDRRGLLPRGALWLVYAIGYTVARFGLELIRTDTTYRLFGLSRNAWVSLAVALLASLLLVWWTRRSRSRLGEPGDPAPATAAHEAL